MENHCVIFALKMSLHDPNLFATQENRAKKPCRRRGRCIQSLRSEVGNAQDPLLDIVQSSPA